MKVGDMVKVKDRGLSLAAAEKFLGHIGVIIGVGDKWGTEVMIKGKVERFVPRYLEVISESL